MGGTAGDRNPEVCSGRGTVDAGGSNRGNVTPASEGICIPVQDGYQTGCLLYIALGGFAGDVAIAPRPLVIQAGLPAI